MKYALILALTILSVHFSSAQDQESKVKIAIYDGVLATGYVDESAYLNFTGPNLNMTVKNSKFILGMLPSLRFKEDRGTTKNSFVTPTLGAGLTYSYRFLAVQVPVYYNTKTTTTNGKWNIGIGLGIRLNGFAKKK